MRQSRRIPDVVVTGIGASTPLGGDAPSSWTALLAGQSGICRLETPWAANVPVKVAAPVMKDPTTALSRVEARTLDRCQQIGLVAAREAWSDAGLTDIDHNRLAVAVASGVGGIATTITQADLFREKGARQLSPHGIPMLMANGPAAVIGLDLGAGAGVHAPVSACASGAEAIALGLTLLRSGRADIVVCGGAEAAIHPVTLAGFAAMRAISLRGDPPEAVSRPFDQDRDGFVLGEGAGILVLETSEHAVARGRRPLAMFTGAAVTSDFHHLTKPDPTGAGAARAITGAIHDSDAEPGDVVHLNAHATSTPLGDLAESVAISAALGAHTSSVPVSATKSTTGHLLGAAGAIEAIFAVLSVRDRIAPMTRNLDRIDDRILLDVVSAANRPITTGLALSNSFGFGGHNVVLAFAPVL